MCGLDALGQLWHQTSTNWFFVFFFYNELIFSVFGEREEEAQYSQMEIVLLRERGGESEK